MKKNIYYFVLSLILLSFSHNLYSAPEVSDGAKSKIEALMKERENAVMKKDIDLFRSTQTLDAIGTGTEGYMEFDKLETELVVLRPYNSFTKDKIMGFVKSSYYKGNKLSHESYSIHIFKKDNSNWLVSKVIFERYNFKWKDQQVRFNKILSKWEEQQDRMDKILAAREKQMEKSEKQYERYDKLLTKREKAWETYEKRKIGIAPDELSEKELDKLPADTIFDLVSKAYKNGYWKTKVKYSKFIIKKFPSYPKAFLALGQTRQLPEEERIEYLEKAVSLPSDQAWIPAQALFRLGQLYGDKGNKDKAIEYYKEIVQRYTRAWNGEVDWVELAKKKIALSAD